VTTSTVHTVEHEVTVSAPARQVYELIADVGRWPEMFPPTVHAERSGQDGDSEQIRIWATANGTARTWTSRRTHDVQRMIIAFRQEKSAPPVGGMGGTWTVEPLSGPACRVRLRHDWFAARDDPADIGFISQAVDRNSTAELLALKERAELTGPDDLLTFEDTVAIDGSAKDVYDFLNEAQRWRERIPHVTRVSLEEEPAGLQILEMDTQAGDGPVHTTRSVRVCLPYRSIVYKQIVLPPLMSLHTGRWLITERPGGGVSASSRHTVRIDPARIADVLGPDADGPAAQQAARDALGANSRATLRLAKEYAEKAVSRPLSP
jgi:aromatase